MADEAYRLSVSGDTTPVREGELVDVEALRTWMAAALPTIAAQNARISVRQFPAGFSNLTYLVRLETGHGQFAYVLRRPPRGVKPGVAHDMGREHDILAALHPMGVPVPKPVARCDDSTVIGAQFYLMEHVDGVILRGPLPPELVTDADGMREQLSALSRAFVTTLAGLHAVNVRTEPLRSIGRAGGYVERQVQGWTKRWLASRIDSVPDIERVAAWLEANRPPDRDVTLVHNDFKFDNLVLDASRTRVRAILDWEMATIGDPLMDLGTSLAYWVQADDAPAFRALGLGLTALPGNATRTELVHMYGAATGRDTGNAAYYYAFGLFKVAVIAQQIYARFARGLTTDARFARLADVVVALGASASIVSRTGRL